MACTEVIFRFVRARGVDLCFSIHPLDNFDVKMPQDFNGASLAELEDEICFKQARPGDHLYVPF
jgi:hypothetical protein